MGLILKVLHNDTFLQNLLPPPCNPNQFITFHHERVELKTLAHKPPSPLPLLDSYNKFNLSKRFWSVYFHFPPTPLGGCLNILLWVSRAGNSYSRDCESCNNQNGQPPTSQGGLTVRVSWRVRKLNSAAQSSSLLSGNGK